MNPSDNALLRWAEEDVVQLLALSADLYMRWESDAAFYTLRAAEAAALSPDQYARIRAVAVARRDEWMTADLGVTAANHGVNTLDYFELDTAPGYHDSYQALVLDIDRWTQSRRQEVETGRDNGMWREYGWGA